MKTLYLECKMGAAGDMLTAALLELLPDKQVFIDKMNSLGIPGVEVSSTEMSYTYRTLEKLEHIFPETEILSQKY